MAIQVVCYALIVAICGIAWSRDVRQRKAEHLQAIEHLSAHYAELRANDIAIGNAALRAATTDRATSRALLVGVANAWCENEASVDALILSRSSVDVKRRRRAAQEALKLAAEAVVVAVYDPAPWSGVRVVEKKKEVRCG